MRKITLFIMLFALSTGFQASAQELKIGSQCWALWEENNTYYVGTIVELDSTVKGGGYLVVYADGGVAVVPATLVFPFKISVGTPVHAMWWRDGDFYPGKIAKIVGEALYIYFDDGDEGWTSLAGISIPAPK